VAAARGAKWLKALVLTGDSDTKVESVLVAASVLQSTDVMVRVGPIKVDAGDNKPLPARKRITLDQMDLSKRVVYLNSTRCLAALRELYGENAEVLFTLTHIVNSNDVVPSMAGIDEALLFSVLTGNVFKNYLWGEEAPAFFIINVQGLKLLTWPFFRRWIMCCYAWIHRVQLTILLKLESLDMSTVSFDSLCKASYMNDMGIWGSRFYVLRESALVPHFLRVRGMLRM